MDFSGWIHAALQAFEQRVLIQAFLNVGDPKSKQRGFDAKVICVNRRKSMREEVPMHSKIS